MTSRRWTGAFDIVMCLGLYYHLWDPFTPLRKSALLTRWRSGRSRGEHYLFAAAQVAVRQVVLRD